jgi:hypothetical protein
MRSSWLAANKKFQSHYIGRARPSPPFMDGDATFDYVTDMDHIPWTWPLAVWADQYKHGKATVTEESLVLEYCEYYALLPVVNRISSNSEINSASFSS